MGHHLYEENKRLKAENENLREQLRHRRFEADRDDVAALASDALVAFIQGKAALVSTSGNDPNSRIFYFQMPAKETLSALTETK